ncbi:uncharacterized protein sowah isoform X2 [Plodia interpunctella]|uniref:uncharacterized protein sowah isoform X2 n=1 Tax=Plodia interpunctella TaxID=58824 RepID=UPI002368E3D4|nr:uncharacterized protein LOC128683029 isoform X2 [Plodia interpunctella]
MYKMSAPSELSFDEILKFMLVHNGRVTNHELVKHFKVFLKNPDMRDEARSTFKKHVNTLANIKNQDNEKWLILKKKYMPSGKESEEDVTEIKVNDPVPVTTPDPIMDCRPEPEPVPYRPPPPVQLNQDFSILNNLIQDSTNGRNSQEYILKQSNEDNSNSVIQSPNMTDTPMEEDGPPKVFPRRRSADKISNEKRSSIPGPDQRTSIPNHETLNEEPMSPALTTSRSESMLVDSEQKISVKERKQMFNRMASESDDLKSNKLGVNFSMQGVDEEDRVSSKSENEPLDNKQKQWILCAARGEYHALAKMCKENAKLAKTKTAMHWACKRGDENLVKLLAGVARHLVNERSNGVSFYCPLLNQIL